MNENCKCPRTKCKRHGNCDECRAFHADETKVISFCRWAEITGFDSADSKLAVKAWLSNDRSQFSADKWVKKK